MQIGFVIEPAQAVFCLRTLKVKGGTAQEIGAEVVVSAQVTGPRKVSTCRENPSPKENACLKRIVADQALDIDMLEELAEVPVL